MPSKKSNRAKNVSNNDNDHFQNGQQTSKDGEGGIKPKNAVRVVRQNLSSDNESPHDSLVNELQDHAMQSQLISVRSTARAEMLRTSRFLEAPHNKPHMRLTLLDITTGLPYGQRRIPTRSRTKKAEELERRAAELKAIEQ